MGSVCGEILGESDWGTLGDEEDGEEGGGDGDGGDRDGDLLVFEEGGVEVRV